MQDCHSNLLISLPLSGQIEAAVECGASLRRYVWQSGIGRRLRSNLCLCWHCFRTKTSDRNLVFIVPALKSPLLPGYWLYLNFGRVMIPVHLTFFRQG